ncbi:Trafficking protein particle complex subunit 10 [Colletotrichum trifolii]|uniref:Trafficking protein particle complex subunit 10 n=1 Tax=Colletotrichum trifolii TaxID=5466 RepID=A0A4R8RMB5_COLTR|nr:Trafficking protein particle complex subunit 10 [Colletotrichum trifolii]
MERAFSTSKVTVEYYDPHDVYKLIQPGLVPRLPLRNLHWQSHAGPLRSIDTLHIELTSPGGDPAPPGSPTASLRRTLSASTKDDGFQTQSLGGKSVPSDPADISTAIARQSGTRRHQIPGLRRTPYLKVLLVRCDDNDIYKSQTRAEIREWLKEHTPPSQSTRKANTQENHDAFEWLIVHVVIPNTAAANQPRVSGKGPDTAEKSRTSRWGSGSSTLLEKLRSDFNSSSKSSADRIAQIRIGINDVPYDILPRVAPAIPTGYSESRQDAENAWEDLIGKFKELILSSFDMRVGQYEEDIKEKDSQRALPGWNFCTFFILKEGLARGFESVGLVEDALVGYDELSVGLDTVIQEQAASGDPQTHGGSLLSHTEDLVKRAEAAVQALGAENGSPEDEEPVDLQATDVPKTDKFDDIPISSTKKPYREMIVANNVSVYDFRCYIFARQISLLLRLGNAWSTREELLAKLREQQESVLHGVAPRAPAPKQTEEAENLSMLAEICRRTLEFIPAVSQVMRTDIMSALNTKYSDASSAILNPALAETIDNLVASFAFSVAQQILAQTSTKALPIPPSTLTNADAQEPKASIPELKTMMHPARNSSLSVRTNTTSTRPPPSPGIFPGARRPSAEEATAPNSQFLKAGLEELAARRAELYALSRNVLQGSGKKRGWDSGWTSAPVLGASENSETDAFEEIDLDGEDDELKTEDSAAVCVGLAGIENALLYAALDNREDFYRLYETLTDKALRHYTVANHTHAVKTSMADLGVLKYHLGEFSPAASFFYMTTPFFGENSWSILELSMLVMYSHCLRELQRKDEFVRVGLKLLTKAAAAENERLSQKTSSSIVHRPDIAYPEKSAINGFLNEILSVAATLSSEVKVPLNHLFTQVEVEGPPQYHEGRDRFSLTIKLRSLLVDEVKVEKASLRLCRTTQGGTKEITLHTSEGSILKPGLNKLLFISTTNVSGHYRIDKADIVCDNVHLHWERDVNQVPSKTAHVFRVPDLQLYRPAGGLQCRLMAARDIQLDKNNSVDLEVSTGWNSITSCELSVKPATGGLRITSKEAEFLGPSFGYERPPEAGLFKFGVIPESSSIKMRFPYTIEQDVPNISVKVEVTYTTEDSTYHHSSVSSIPIALALGVNVQDVFKDKALFSRFSVSTASSSPLRLFEAKLMDSDVFQSHSASATHKVITVFPKQPASLLYKITRRSADVITAKTLRTLYLKLEYSVLLDEIIALVEESLTEATKEFPLATFSSFLVGRVLAEIRSSLSNYELERAALLSEVPTAFITPLLSETAFAGLGIAPGTEEDASVTIKTFLKQWQATNPKLAIKEMDWARRTILIPVDVPSIPVFHSIDIQIPPPEKRTSETIAINQLLPANLRLRWTRIWDTAVSDGKSINKDYEFSYEVTGLPETWLVGGRRRGHFRSLGVDKTDTKFGESELHVPVLLVPLREGRLPYPNVEIREVKEETDESAQGHGHHEIDYQNIGETVRVVSDLQRVTLSLDASGPNGGPLVLESERREFSHRILL